MPLRLRLLSVVCAALAAVACQGWDRLEPDRPFDSTAGDRGTLFDAGGGPLGGGPLTEEGLARSIRRIETSTAEQRLELAAQFLAEYPEAGVIGYLHELVGDAHAELGDQAAAAAAYERAISFSWPKPDVLGLPLVNLELPSQAGWARYRAGDRQAGIDWLVRATFASDLPQLEQGLRFMFAELGDPAAGYGDWLAARRSELAVAAPGFELPGYQSQTVALAELAGRLTLLNFWTPT